LKFQKLNVEEFYNDHRFKFPLKYADFKDIGVYKMIHDDSIYYGGWKD